MCRGHHASEIHNFGRLYGFGLWQRLSDHRNRRPQSSPTLFNGHQTGIASLMGINSLRDSTWRNDNRCVVYSLDILDIALIHKRNVIYPLRLGSKVLGTEESLIILMVCEVLMRLISSQHFWTFLLLLVKHKHFRVLIRLKSVDPIVKCLTFLCVVLCYSKFTETITFAGRMGLLDTSCTR